MSRSSLANNPLSSSKGYRADVDGLRAVAVLSVVFFHAFPALLPGGFVGVDIFFVLSGYLISGIIFQNLKREKFSFSDFYIRRVKRIFPALLTLFVACYLAGLFMLLPDDFAQIGKHIFGGAFFSSNFLLWRETGYFDEAAALKTFLHLWSLGIEEQFYIFWPALTAWAWRRGNSTPAVLILSVLALSFSLNIGLIHHYPSATFYLPITRIWELLFGSALAYQPYGESSQVGWVNRLSARCKMWMEHNPNVLATSGMALVTISILGFSESLPFPGWWALFPVAGTVLVIAGGPGAWLNSKFLAHPLVVWFGLISYPLYLWHWPMLVFARLLTFGAPSQLLLAACALGSILLAWLTYWFVERPIRFGNFSKSGVFVLGALMFVVSLIGIGTRVRDGFPGRYPQYVEFTKDTDWDNPDAAPPCPKEFTGISSYCEIANRNAPPTVVLIGDSHAQAGFPGLARYYQRKGENLLLLGAQLCLPAYHVLDHNRPCEPMTNALDFALRQPSIRTIVLLSRGPVYTTGDGYGAIDGHDVRLALADSPLVRGNSAVFAAALRETLSRLVASGKKIVYFVALPEMGFYPRDCIAAGAHQARVPCGVPIEDYKRRTDAYRALLNGVLRDFPTVKVFDPSPYLCDSKLCSPVVDGHFKYHDDDHLSRDGSIFIADKFGLEDR